ncbi:SCO family protein [Pseudomonas benzenivorans]|uniref:SCO family protein n=1 Tax=Pseudomonas benzenivorans TaxID=556533 RepID=A0ABZ0PY14_9PSED|nr:SCO family protein [Pseudomonas benzenivorans]WPC06103.1 SCO family protein [Pseudomonas benzenivorans]
MPWVWLIAAAALLAVTALSYGRPAAAERWGADYFPNVPLVTQDGKRVRLYDDLLKGKAVVINVIYTHCQDKCPLGTAKLAQVQRLLGDKVGREIFFYSLSIDPERDSPAVLKAYAERFRVGPGWLFLTGEPADIALVQKKLGLWSRTDAADPDGHLTGLMIGNEPSGQWMRQSGLDNPQFLATRLSSFLLGWQRQTAAAEPGYDAAAPIDGLDAGGYLFRTRCAACHTIGGGDALGPDLLGVTARRERAWLQRFIQAPDQLLAQRDPIAVELFARFNQVRMPNLWLGDGDVEALLQFLEAQGAARAGAPAGNSPVLRQE